MRTLSTPFAAFFIFCGIAAQSSADTLTCHFTEPYITITHDTSKATVEVSGLGIETETYTNTGLQLVDIHRLALDWGEDIRLEMTLNYKGGDQMSDHIYPMAARFFRVGDTRATHGGCVSDNLPMIIPADMPE